MNIFPQTLALSGVDLSTNQPFCRVINASNLFMLGFKCQNLNNNLLIKGWTLINQKWESGNTGLNATAFLYETLEDLTGMKF